jgi:hypothetical protein
MSEFVIPPLRKLGPPPEKKIVVVQLTSDADIIDGLTGVKRDQKPGMLDDEFNAHSAGRPCPWVKIGDLYVSYTTQGAGSWESLFEYLYSKGKRKFKIYTGRHGNEYGSVIDPETSLFHSIKDRDHTEQDNEGVQQKQSKYGSSVSIEAIDITDVAYNTVDKMRELATNHLQQGYVVVFAWCFSLYSMKGTSYKNSKVALGFLGKVARDRSIREIVSDEFEWVRIIINAR